mmetsp:Transcript_48246/g.121431  ORF Transcript_48246/g.121431 Transcript_48246/m.121431 type:complete len:211 (+) Transcript_48246:205-837(+)
MGFWRIGRQHIAADRVSDACPSCALGAEGWGQPQAVVLVQRGGGGAAHRLIVQQRVCNGALAEQAGARLEVSVAFLGNEGDNIWPGQGAGRGSRGCLWGRRSRGCLVVFESIGSDGLPGNGRARHPPSRRRDEGGQGLFEYSTRGLHRKLRKALPVSIRLLIHSQQRRCFHCGRPCWLLNDVVFSDRRVTTGGGKGGCLLRRGRVRVHRE